MGKENVNTPEVKPEVTPEGTPEVTPDVTPEVTPELKPEGTPEVTPDITTELIPDVTPEVEQSEEDKLLREKAEDLMEQVGLPAIWFVASKNMWYSSEEKATNRLQEGEEFKHFVKSN